MKEQWRLFLALGLSLLLLLAYQELVIGRRPESGNEASSTAAVAVEDRRPGQSPGAEKKAPQRVIDRGFSASAPADDDVVVFTDRFHAVLSRRGGRLKSIEIRGYKAAIGGAGSDIDLVLPGPVLPLTATIGDRIGDAQIRYDVNRKELSVTGSEQGDVTFRWARGRHRIEKTYRFRGDSFVFEVTGSGSFKGKSISGFVFTPLRPDGPHADQTKDMAVVLADGKRTETASTSLVGGESTSTRDATWAGFSTQYFLMAGIGERQSATVGTTAGWPSVRMGSGSSDPVAIRVFAGPKESSVLEGAGSDLSRALDFGWFWFVAQPLLQLMRWLFAVTGNYGVAIILLTTLVRAATIPLSQSSFKNMREMQKLQPHVERLKERYKDDQMAFQKELMELYKKRGVNPLSGCLPMLLQLPVFVGLYNALYHAIELRHAPFAFWIDDLSAPDRLMIAGVGVPVLTILMGASMLVQQMLTPQQGDPTQRTMMMIMPVVFTFMFINFPSGLVLYWLVSNVLSIAQQYYVMRMAK